MLDNFCTEITQWLDLDHDRFRFIYLLIVMQILFLLTIACRLNLVSMLLTYIAFPMWMKSVVLSFVYGDHAHTDESSKHLLVVHSINASPCWCTLSSVKFQYLLLAFSSEQLLYLYPTCTLLFPVSLPRTPWQGEWLD